MIKGVIGIFVAIVLMAVFLPALYSVFNEMSPGSSSTLVPIFFGLIFVLGAAVVLRFFRK